MSDQRQVSIGRGSDPSRLVQHRRRPAAGAARPSSRHRQTDRPRRPRAAVPDGADRPGSQHRARDRDPRSGARDLSHVAADAALSRARAREGARHDRAHLLQIRGRQPGRQPQAEHRGGAGLLQQAGGGEEAHHRDRRRPMGLVARLRRRPVRPRGQGLHGQGLLRPEALSAGADGDLRGDLRRQPEQRDQLRPRHPRRQPEFAGQSRHRHLRGGRGRRSERRHQIFARQRAQSRAVAPDGDRPGGDRADGGGRRLSRRGDRLRRRRVEFRRHRLPVPRQEAARQARRAASSPSSRRPVRR